MPACMQFVHIISQVIPNLREVQAIPQRPIIRRRKKLFFSSFTILLSSWIAELRIQSELSGLDFKLYIQTRVSSHLWHKCADLKQCCIPHFPGQKSMWAPWAVWLKSYKAESTELSSWAGGGQGSVGKFIHIAEKMVYFWLELKKPAIHKFVHMAYIKCVKFISKFRVL